ncbi:hypothetical protein Dimus_010447 [Dionaea muscipula]
MEMEEAVMAMEFCLDGGEMEREMLASRDGGGAMRGDEAGGWMASRRWDEEQRCFVMEEELRVRSYKEHSIGGACEDPRQTIHELNSAINFVFILWWVEARKS